MSLNGAVLITGTDVYWFVISVLTHLRSQHTRKTQHRQVPAITINMMKRVSAQVGPKSGATTHK